LTADRFRKDHASTVCLAECRLSELCEDLWAPAEAVLSGLHGAARALALAAWQVGTGRTLFVLCRSDEVAAALAQDSPSSSARRWHSCRSARTIWRRAPGGWRCSIDS